MYVAVILATVLFLQCAWCECQLVYVAVILATVLFLHPSLHNIYYYGSQSQLLVHVVVVFFIFRPSACELLKHPFFKKARNKEFVKEVVLGDAPSLQSRAKHVKRRPGASGRLHRTEEGGWVWSDDEMTEDFEGGDDSDVKVHIYVHVHCVQNMALFSWAALKRLGESGNEAMTNMHQSQHQQLYGGDIL